MHFNVIIEGRQLQWVEGFRKETQNQITTKCQRCDEAEMTSSFAHESHNLSGQVSSNHWWNCTKSKKCWWLGLVRTRLDPMGAKHELSTLASEWSLVQTQQHSNEKIKKKKTSRDWNWAIRQQTARIHWDWDGDFMGSCHHSGPEHDLNLYHKWCMDNVLPGMSLVVERVCVTAAPVLSLSPTGSVIDHWGLFWQAMEVSRVWMKLWKTARVMEGTHDSPLCAGRRDERHLSAGEAEWAEERCSTTEQHRWKLCTLISRKVLMTLNWSIPDLAVMDFRGKKLNWCIRCTNLPQLSHCSN